MGRHDDLIEMLRNPGDEPLPETIYDDLGAEYAAVLAGSAERDEIHAAEILAKEQENSALKAQNYDLLMAQARPVDAAPETDTADDTQDDEGIESLFD